MRKRILGIVLSSVLPLTFASESRGGDLRLETDCDVFQRFTTLPLSCGNHRCERLFAETAQTCPQDCLNSKTHVISYYAQSHICPEATTIHEPKTVDELGPLVRSIKSRGKTIKLIGSLHSITDIKCPTNGEVIAMGAMNRILGIEDYKGKKTVHLEGNVRFWDLVNWLDAKGFALDQRIPGFGGISVGGFIATGAHGSNTRGSASIPSSIVSLEIIGADGKSKVYDQTNTTPDQWRALRTNLGALGIVARVRFEVRPRYNMRAEIREYDADLIFDGDALLKAAAACDFLFAHYMRGMEKIYFTCGAQTAEKENPPKLANTLFLPPSPSAFDKLAVASFQQAACSDKVARSLEKLISESRNKNPWLTWTDSRGKRQHTRQGVGSWQRIMEVDFNEDSQPKFSQIDWEVAIPQKHFAAAMAEMRAFMDRNNVIIPSIGVILRFDQAQEDSLLSPSAADERIAPGERLVHLEMPVYTPYGLNETQLEAWRKPYRDFFLYLIEAYGARPHYGKNDNALFTSEITKRRMSSSLFRFRKIMKEMDPAGTFSNEYLKKIGLD